jgi:hypothetical protein
MPQAGCGIRVALPGAEISANVHRARRVGAADHGAGGVLGRRHALVPDPPAQLKVYGADVFIVNILGIGVWRELGPMLAAILVAGRSGSAMTRAIGRDAGYTGAGRPCPLMGISHTARLVLPKVLAVALATMPPGVTVLDRPRIRTHARWRMLARPRGTRHRSGAVRIARALPGSVPV